MKKQLKVAIIAGVVIAAGLGVSAYNMKSGDTVVAMVNEKPIYESDIVKQFKEISDANNPMGNVPEFSSLDLETKKNLIKSIIVSDIIVTKADESKVQDTQQFKKMMDQQAFQIKQRVFLDKEASSEITESKIKQKYEEFVKIEGNKEEVRATQILFKEEDTAKAKKIEIASVAQFDEIVNANKAANPKNDGDLGYFTKDQMVPSISEASFDAKPGDIVGPVKTDFGWHILKIVDRRKVNIPSFEEMKSRIKSDLFLVFINDYYEKTLEENKVQILIK
jgi:peptidyl-prolyl cis-trans isomerase C